MKRIVIFFIGLIVCLVMLVTCWAKQALIVKKVVKAPIIDGKAEDAVWQKAEAIVTHDKVADIDITLKAVYIDKEIFFLVSFPDPDESRAHKSWLWDKESDIYVSDSDREDVFQFVWSMETNPVDLSIYADNSYKADVWYWKAFRTDPAGFADDKVHYFSDKEMERATKLVSRSGKTMYLLRVADSGESAYKSVVYGERQDDILPRFVHRMPSGSRADIKAKGYWQDGYWTIEFSRALNTKNSDDIQFEPGQEYLFGISRYEIGGRKPQPELNQPLYGCGDITEELRLVFEQ
jgi:hypothetical protein